MEQAFTSKTFTVLLVNFIYIKVFARTTPNSVSTIFHSPNLHSDASKTFKYKLSLKVL